MVVPILALSIACEVAREYSTQIRELALELLKGISEGLGLEECYIEKAMDLERGFQLFAVNFYPLCPKPELAMGIPPHTDYGLLTCLISNGIDGLQILRDGKWHNVKSLPDSILINVADQLEILSNGKCRSDRHRAVVNNNATRISIAMAHGPSIDKVVGPAPELVDMESRPSKFVPMEFKKYVELNHANPIGASPYFEQLRPENAK
ncbi:hypothetical protein Acr_10g0003190 [Actinidia rufa]|uniref:Fe2OG dioxygenase domain-containing protein n=1 Tax=Actinidia rufa TaxID=165716 RepID=A0A7J0F8A1_9ERIC|nr:hypothetical protein Acr_10g0003190 [Actinidia rufa]